MHGEAATNYSVVPWGGAAFNATQFSRQELLTTNIGDILASTLVYTLIVGLLNSPQWKTHTLAAFLSCISSQVCV